jgi:hypothetical protein
MDGFNDFKELRVKTDLGVNEDYAATQNVTAPLVVLQRPGSISGRTPIVIKVELVLEWLTSGNAVVTGVDRGSYDIQAIRVSPRRSPLTGDMVVDSATLRQQIGHRPVIVTDVLVGDSFTAGLSNMTPPAGGSAVKARILYREII